MAEIAFNLPAVVVKCGNKNFLGKKIIITTYDGVKNFKFKWVDEDMAENYKEVFKANRANFEFVV